MHALLCRELKRPYKHQGFMLSRINIRLHITSKGDRHGPSYRQQKQMPLNGHTEATAMPMAFHLLPVAAYTGAATMTPYTGQAPVSICEVPRRGVSTTNEAGAGDWCMLIKGATTETGSRVQPCSWLVNTPARMSLPGLEGRNECELVDRQSQRAGSPQECCALLWPAP